MSRAKQPVDGTDHVTVRWSGPEGVEIAHTVPSTEVSLARWLSLNIDPSADGQPGLAPFSRSTWPLHSLEWREDLLIAAREWARMASLLDGFSTVISFGNGHLEIINPADTREFIDWTLRFLRFAEIVYVNSLPVTVDLRRGP